MKLNIFTNDMGEVRDFLMKGVPIDGLFYDGGNGTDIKWWLDEREEALYLTESAFNHERLLLIGEYKPEVGRVPKCDILFIQKPMHVLKALGKIPMVCVSTDEDSVVTALDTAQLIAAQQLSIGLIAEAQTKDELHQILSNGIQGILLDIKLAMEVF